MPSKTKTRNAAIAAESAALPKELRANPDPRARTAPQLDQRSFKRAESESLPRPPVFRFLPRDARFVSTADPARCQR